MSWNKGSLDLENGSRIVASSTSSSAVRGGSYNMIFLDEFVFVPHNVAEDFFSSVYPTISSGTEDKSCDSINTKWYESILQTLVRCREW